MYEINDFCGHAYFHSIQDTFLSIALMQREANEPLSSLLEFRRPNYKREESSSALIEFTDKQHDVMYV